MNKRRFNRQTHSQSVDEENLNEPPEPEIKKRCCQETSIYTITFFKKLEFFPTSR